MVFADNAGADTYWFAWLKGLQRGVSSTQHNSRDYCNFRKLVTLIYLHTFTKAYVSLEPETGRYNQEFREEGQAYQPVDCAMPHAQLHATHQAAMQLLNPNRCLHQNARTSFAS